MSAQSRFSTQKRVPLKGSTRKAFDVSRVQHVCSRRLKEDEPITVSVLLPRKAPIDPTVRVTREEFAEKYGPDERAKEVVRSFAAEYGLSVEDPTEPGRRSLYLTGSRETHGEGVRRVAAVTHDESGYAAAARKERLRCRRK